MGGRRFCCLVAMSVPPFSDSRRFPRCGLPGELPIQQELHIPLAAKADHTFTILRHAYNENNP
jgi:hypothetical protein